jgi:hypothetical protein
MLQRRSLVQRHPEQDAAIAANKQSTDAVSDVHAGAIRYHQFLLDAHESEIDFNEGRIDYVSGWATDGITENQNRIADNASRISNLEQNQGRAAGGGNVVVPANGGV